ncbi:MAG: ABC transporter ATP-binding protein [Chloroflexi bacterium]|nr:ABC transporter ATP-binding protein [Chloroflexota bacterium]
MHGHVPVDLDLPDRPLRRGVLARVWRLFRPYRPQLVFVTFLVLASAGLGIVVPLLIARVIDVAIPAGDRPHLIWLVIGMIAATALGGALNFLQAQLNTNIGLRVMRDVRQAVYEHLQRLPLRFFTSTRTGDLQSRLSSDVAGTQAVLTDTLRDLVSNFAVVVGSMIAMLLISWELSLIALGMVPVFIVLTVRVGRRRRALTRDTQRTLSELTAMTGETLSVSGVLLAKTFAREREHRDKFEVTNRQLTELSIRQQMVGRAFFIGVQTFFGIAPAIIWLVGGWLRTGGVDGITIGGIVAFTTLQTRLLFPLAGLLNRGVEISSSIALFDRIFEYLDQAPEIKDPPDPVPLDLAKVRGGVRFNHVSFSYRQGESSPAETAPTPTPPPSRGEGLGASEMSKDGQGAEGWTPQFENGAGAVFSLHDVDFVASPGELTAIVGPSGSGKTTVGYLLARLYDVGTGAVTIDGVDIRKLALNNLNRLVGVVTQDTFLFHTTVGENLRYGKPDASDGAVVAAARAAQIHETVLRLPDGYETVVGERGYRMSGGERQRVAIARVILADPRILLLDEATSSLDSVSEGMILQAMTDLMRGRTRIAIAHRLSTILSADCILVMDEGRIIDRGRHGELLERCGLYRELYEQQFQAANSAGTSERSIRPARDAAAASS